jgi:hypothetical protein
MRPPIMLVQIQAPTIEEDRHRGVELRHAHQRSVPETHAAGPRVPARLVALATRVARRDRHSLIDYPCRLADGSIGRTAVIQRDGEWTLEYRSG